MTNGSGQIGHVVQIIGPVVDIEFSEIIYHQFIRHCALLAKAMTSKHRSTLSPKCSSIFGEGRVRAVSMLPTDGMVRGMKAIDQGDPITMPVGVPTLAA